MSAIVAIAVNHVAISEVHLEHGTEALHNCRNSAARKHLAQSRDGGVPNVEELLVSGAIVGQQQVKTSRYNLHGQAMSIEGAVVQHHPFTPARAIENLSTPRVRSDGKTRAQSLAEDAEVRSQAVHLLATAGRVAEAGDRLVEDEQRAVLVSQFAHAFQVSRSWKYATHVGHDWLGNHGSQFMTMLSEDFLQHIKVIPSREHDVTEGARWDACGIRQRVRSGRRTKFFRRMRVRVQKIWVIPAVIMAFELEELGASGVGTCQAQSEHGRFSAAVAEAHGFGGRNHAAEALRRFNLSGRRRRKMRAFGDGFRNRLDDGGMGVPMDECAEGHHEVNVLIVVDVEYARAPAAIQHDRTGLVHRRPARG